MALSLGPLRRRSTGVAVPEPGRDPRRVRAALGRLLPAVRRILPPLAFALLVLTPAVAVGALAMRSGSETPPPLAAAAPPGPTGASGTTGPTTVAPAVGPTGSTGTTGAVAVRSPRPGAEYYRRTAKRRVSASAEVGFLPLYKEAARVFGVDWRLIASVHRQETAFSSEPSTYRGLNAYGCCAGPMQFNVTNGPVSTWDSYRDAFRQGNRPSAYPHPTRKHPSVYDDFDVMMAAGALLRDGGARGGLDGGAWLAAYAYYGHDEFGVGYASQVLARAIAWRRDGFAVNSADDPALFARLEDEYGVFERQKLRAGSQDAAAAEERSARRKAKRERTRQKAAEATRARAADRRLERAPAKKTKPARSPEAKPPSEPAPRTPAPAPAAPSGTTDDTGAR